MFYSWPIKKNFKDEAYLGYIFLKESMKIPIFKKHL